MTAFFVPGISGDEQAVEQAYDGMRRQTELDLGRRPTSRRIFGLWTRRGTVDCVTQVGMRDPLLGGTVVAIFDLGASQPFVVWWQQELESAGVAQEVLGCNAYSVQDFDG